MRVSFSCQDVIIFPLGYCCTTGKSDFKPLIIIVNLTFTACTSGSTRCDRSLKSTRSFQILLVFGRLHGILIEFLVKNNGQKKISLFIDFYTFRRFKPIFRFFLLYAKTSYYSRDLRLNYQIRRFIKVRGVKHRY